jgi:division/cell wall cluster transcriptional repressor MraZ
MLQFCGLEKTQLDGNGRLKLGARLQQSFASYGSQTVILYNLPEGGIGMYPLAEWEKIKPDLKAIQQQFTGSILARRRMRMMGAMTSKESLSNQGRVTIPQMFREMCGLEASSEVMLVGSEFGIEIWGAEAWQKEMMLMQQHSLEKGENEMSADLEMREDI